MLRRQIATAFIAIAALTAIAAVRPKVIAHRGYWNTEGSAQNSMRSLAKADSIGAWGTEFDLWLTADGVLVLNHDSTIDGVGEVQKAQSADVIAAKLPNGENHPTLEQCLTEAAKLRPHLICEMKTHWPPEHQQDAVNAILEAFSRHGLTDRVTYIMFSQTGMVDFVRQAPEGTEVYLLEGVVEPAVIHAAGASGIDYNLGVLQARPWWIKQAHDLGLKVNAWTVNTREGVEWCLDNDVDFITTDIPVEVEQWIAERFAETQ